MEIRSSKKAKIRLIVFVLLFCIILGSVTVSAGSRNSIEGISQNPMYMLDEMYVLGQSENLAGHRQTNTIYVEVTPGDELRIPLTADMFEWKDGRRPAPMQAVSLSELKSNNVTVRTKKQAGAMALDYVQFDSGTFRALEFYRPDGKGKTHTTAYISIMMAEEYVSVKDLEFIFDIYITTPGRSFAEHSLEVTVCGVLANDVYSMESDYEYIDISDAVILEPMLTVMSPVTVDIGAGVEVHRPNMIQGTKYYGTAEILPPTKFEEIGYLPEVYPAVQKVMKLKTVNLKFGAKVTFDFPEEAIYYVYDEDMVFVGMSDEEFYYADYYFLTTEEIPSFEQEEYILALEKMPSRTPAEILGYETGEMGEEALPKTGPNLKDYLEEKGIDQSIIEDYRYSANRDYSFYQRKFANDNSQDSETQVDGNINLPRKKSNSTSFYSGEEGSSSISFSDKDVSLEEKNEA